MPLRFSLIQKQRSTLENKEKGKAASIRRFRSMAIFPLHEYMSIDLYLTQICNAGIDYAAYSKYGFL